MEPTMIDRAQICQTLWSCTQVTRADIFGDEDILPNSSSENAQHMWAGYVGRNYQKDGPLFIAHFPAGGTDAYDNSRHAQNDRDFYAAIQKFKFSTEETRAGLFESLNDVTARMIPQWDIYRVIHLALKGLAKTLDEIAFINAVPYRVLGNRKPSSREIDSSWRLCTASTINVLQPSKIIALGVAAGNAINRNSNGSIPIYTLPRRIGDKSIHPDAIRICADMADTSNISMTSSSPLKPEAFIACSNEPSSTIQDSKFYVYILRKPDGEERYGGKGTPFYVGKGQGNRMYAHEREARESSESNAKLDTIRSILNAGKKIIYDVESKHDHEPWGREEELIHKIGRLFDGTGPLTNAQTYSESTKYEGVELRKYAEHHISAGSLDAIPAKFKYKSTRLMAGPVEPISRISVFGKIYTVLEANPGITGEQLVRLLQKMDFQGNKSAYTQSGKVCAEWIVRYIEGGFYRKNRHIQIKKD